MEKFLSEDKLVVSTITPGSVAAGATGERVKMGKRVAFVVDLGEGTSTTAHEFVLQQHTLASAGTTKALKVANPIYHKVGSAKAFTRLDVATETDSFDLHSVIADAKALVVLEVLAEQLDDGCQYVSLDLSATGGTQAGAGTALVDTAYKPAYEQEN